MTTDRAQGWSLFAIATLVVGFLSAPVWAKGGVLFLIGILAIQIAFAVSFNMIFGLVGLVSFGHAAYFAVGAYVTAYLTRDVPHLPVIVSWLAGGLAAGLVGAMIGIVALRRASGIYFAVLTLALGELIHLLISKTTFLGREDGFTGIPRPTINLGLAQIDLADTNTLFYVVLVAAMLLVAWMASIWFGPLGRALSAVRQDADRAAFLGIDTVRMQLLAFVLAAAVAGMAGGLYAPWSQLITPEIANWTYSAIPILFCLLGGSSNFWGPVLGGILRDLAAPHPQYGRPFRAARRQCSAACRAGRARRVDGIVRVARRALQSIAGESK